MEKDQDKIKTSIKKKTNKNRDVVVLYSSLLVSCVVLYFLARPLYLEKISLENDIISKTEDLKNKQSLLSNIEKFNSENSNLAVDLEKLTLFISKRNNYEDVIDYLDDLAVANNLMITTYSISAQDGVVSASITEPAGAPAVTVAGEGAATSGLDASSIKKQDLSFDIKGDYASFIGFLRNLENGVPFFQESSINISGESEKIETIQGDQAQEDQAVNTNPTLTFTVELDFVHY